MKLNGENNILSQLTTKSSIEEVSKDALQRIVVSYPYFSTAQLMLAKKMRLLNDNGFRQQVQKTALHFSNPMWLHYQLMKQEWEEAEQTEMLIHRSEKQLAATHGNLSQGNEAEEKIVSERIYSVAEKKFITPEGLAEENNEHDQHIYTGSEKSISYKQEIKETFLSETEISEHINILSERIFDNEFPEAAISDTDVVEEPKETVEDELKANLVSGSIEIPGEAITQTENEFNSDNENILIPGVEEILASHDESLEEATHIEPEIPQQLGTLETETAVQIEEGNFVIEEIFAPKEFQDTSGHDKNVEEIISAGSPILEQLNSLPEPELVIQSNDTLIINEDILPSKDEENFALIDEQIVETIDSKIQDATENIGAYFSKIETPQDEETDYNDEHLYSSEEEPVDKDPSNLPSDKISSILSEQLVEFRRPVDKKEEIKIETEPYYTIDYFAAQGIKLRETDDSKDKLTRKMRSFTDWLKQMKRIAPHPTDLGTDETTEQLIKEIAETSNEAKEIVTEAMADILARQGKIDKAIQVYIKLSFLNPSKSTYFAAKIQQLKGM